MKSKRTRIDFASPPQPIGVIRNVALLLVALVSFILISPPIANANASGTLSVERASHVAGLHVFQVNGRKYGITTAIHVISFYTTQYSIAIGLAHDKVDGGLQTPSSMCQRTPDCVAAVNADFFDLTPTGSPDPGDEVGGIIENCVLLHSPEISHQQANLDGHSVTNGLHWSSSLSINGTVVPIAAINQELPMSYRGVHLPLAGTLLFTSPYALTTPSAPGRTTYEFTQVDATTSPTTINTTVDLEFVTETTMPVAVAPGAIDISAPPGSALASLQVGNTVTLNTTSTGGCDDIGGHPILLDQSVAPPIVQADTYMTKPYARTVIGWTAAGDTVLMTVDGKDTTSGATAAQLVRVLRSLDVVTALDLDGGNSTTMYEGGRILNKPSKGFEHPVSTALLVIANS
jgi:exopolysaccharide biosynthesis protein